jgi:Tol biopolymer transport system component
MRACRLTVIALLALFAGCASPPRPAASATDGGAQPPSPQVTPTKVPSVRPTSQATATVEPPPRASPTLAPLATPALPLRQLLHDSVDDVLLYARTDRFLMLTDVHNQRPLWVTAGICNLVNDSTEQSGQWSVDGRYLAVTCNREQQSDRIQTSILDTVTGKVQILLLHETVQVRWSPTSPQVLIQSFTGDGSTWDVVDARSQQITTLTTITDQNSAAAWSPDGTRVALTGHRENPPDTVTIMRSDGSQQRRVPVGDQPGATGLFGPISWSPDGTFLLLNRQLPLQPNTATYQALRLDIDSGQSQILADGLHAVLEFSWSPDGAWFVMGQGGQPGSHLGRWALYRADGTLIHYISVDPQRDDIAIRWLPDSQRLVIMAVRLSVGVEVILRDLQGHETVIARYPNTGPGFPALAIAPSGTYVAVHLSTQGIAILDLAGQEQVMLPGRINAWRPRG